MQRREVFITALDKLFNDGLKNADKLIELDEDKKFYNSMKINRQVTILNVNIKWAKRKSRSEKRKKDC